ncbi:MAG: O-antigen ligase family protein [Solirubrobacteraceae bacterium]
MLVLLVVPYFYAHVWLIAPFLGAAGLVAGTASNRVQPVDMIVLALCLWFTESWLFHPELGISTRLFIEGMLPFQYYLWTRLCLTERLLPKLQWLMLLGGGLASLTLLLEAVRGKVMFADPLRYQWGGNSTEIFRAGGIFGGSPAAGVILAALILMSAVMLRSRSHRRLVRLALASMLLALFLTFARSGYVALIGGAFMLAVTLPYQHWRRALLLAFAISIPIFAVVTSPGTLSSLETSKLISAGIIRSDTVADRFSFLKLAVPLLDDRTSHLLYGRGFDAFEATGAEDAGMASSPVLIVRGGPHDDYIRAILEQGVIGLGLILIWLGGSVLIGLRTVRRLPVGSDRRLLVAGLTAATFSYMLASFFHDLQHDIPDLSIAALITAILVTVCSFPAPEPDAGSAPSG